MTRRDKLGVHAIGIIEQLAELDPVVALHTRIRRAAGRVLGDEIVDDLDELSLQIQRVKRDAELVGDAAGVFGVARGAAALLVVEPAALLVGSPTALTGDCSPWRMKTPITSWPCSMRRWAATLESTPPLMASTTRDILRV